MDKEDTAEEAAIKVEARQFMSDVLPLNEPVSVPAAATIDRLVDMAAWKSTYAAASSKDEALMETFWSIYDQDATSVWTIVYDETEYNEDLDETIEIVTNFMKQTESIQDHCFGVMHTLESLEIEGLWFFNGPDPEEMFGANEESSWFTWSQLGPEATDLVKKAVANIMTPTDGKLNGKLIKDTKAFC
jgi:hypothetical protein